MANDKVLSYIELFQGNLRSFLSEGISRGTQYLPRIQEIFKQEGVPAADLAYVPLIESAFKSTALSRARAKGMWQIMLPTAGDYKLKYNWFVDEERSDSRSRRSPRRSTFACWASCSTATGRWPSRATTWARAT